MASATIMANKVTQGRDPALALDFFLSGFYTHRSQLFAPFKGIGVNVVSFHDPVIDGNNMEDTDLFEWQRRPGFSIFCPTSLSDNEVVNQFYSFRNLNGLVLSFVDTSQRLALFSNTAISTVLTKTTQAQGYLSTIGNMTYFSDGSSLDLLKYDGANVSAWGLAAPTVLPTVTGQGFWQPQTHFNFGNSIQDINGNVQTVTAILVPSGGIGVPTAFSTLALAGGFGTWGGSIGPGGVLSLASNTTGFTNYLFLESMGLNIPSSATVLGVVVSIPKTVVGGLAVDQSVKLVSGGAVVGSEHASAVPWNTSAFTSSTYGGPTDTWSAGLTPAQFNASGPTGFGVAISADITSTTLFNMVQTAKNAATNNGTTTTVSFTNPVTAGNTIILAVLIFDESFVSVTDNHGNVYQQATSTSQGQLQTFVFYASNVAAGTTTITVTVTNQDYGGPNNFTMLSAHEFRGVLTPGPVDVTGTNPGVGGVQASFPTGAVTVSRTDDLIFSCVYTDGGGASAPVGYTLGTTQSFFAASGTQQFSSAFEVPGTSGTFNPTWNLGTQGITVAFKSARSTTVEVGGGSPTVPSVTVYYQLPSGAGPGVSGLTEPLWSAILGGPTNDGGIGWTNYGPITTWYPVTNYPTPVVVLDSNGFLQLATTVSNPVSPWNSSTSYTSGKVVTFGGSYWVAIANSTNIPPSANYTVSTAVGSVTTTVPYWAPAQNPSLTGMIAPVWNTTIGGTTVDGNYTWTNIGLGTNLAVFGYAYVYGYRTIYGHLTTSSPFSNNTGAIFGPLNGSISDFSITGNVVTFQGSNNFQIGNVFTVTGMQIGTYLNEQTFTVTSSTPSALFPLTQVQVNGSNVLTVTAINNLVAGQTVTFSNVAVATFLNGISVTVLSSGLSGTQFEANFTHASYGPTADSGTVLLNGSWTANFTHANVPTTSDTGVASPLITMVAGVGTGSPLCNSVANVTGISVLADIVTVTALNNFQPGLWVTFSGLTNATFLNGQQLQVISVNEPVGTQNTQFQVTFQTPNYAFAPETGTATFNAVEIYRTSDGGGSYLFAGAVTNPGANLPWTFNDFVVDANLDPLSVAPLAHLNDPPPGAPGSTVTTVVGSLMVYWQGRMWLVAGNFVYFSAGPDCENGIPEEAWPPANRFQFAGPPFSLEPTADGTALLVYLADRVGAILGGPETISFYATDFLNRFGISNPNAIFKDESTLGQFTTQQQYVELLGPNKQEIGEHIADYLTSNFSAVRTYATVHRQGLDVGTYLSNGVDRIVRYGNNIQAWSVPSFPSFGAGALRSVETSVGTYSLMAAAPAGGHTSTVGLYNPFQGTNVAIGSGPAWVNPGNITAGNPTSYAVATFSGAATTQVLRAAYTFDGMTMIPSSAIILGVQVSVTGLQTTTSNLTTTIKPTNGGAGATSHTFAFGTSNTTVVFGGPTDTWNMQAWTIPFNLNGTPVVGGLLSFDLTSALTAAGTPSVSISEVQVQITYQNPGNFLYARDVNSWGDGGVFGQNNGQPYSICNVTFGNITLAPLGAKAFSLEHVVGYFAAVGNLGDGETGGPSQPDVWIMPNEVSATLGATVGFIQLPTVSPEPPTGQTTQSGSLLALRWPVNMINSSLTNQFVHHLQLKIQFEPENAPNAIKAIAFKENVD